MKYFVIKNLRSRDVAIKNNINSENKPKPKFKSKADYRAWCAKDSTEHLFYSTVEGDSPNQRVTNDNPPRVIYGIVADYDAPVEWGSVKNTLTAKCGDKMPTWISETESGYIRLVWEFEKPLPITMEMFAGFMKHIRKTLLLDRLLAGFDATSIKPNQYFEIGAKWEGMGPSLKKEVTHTAFLKSANEKPPQTTEVAIPIDIVGKKMEEAYPHRWNGEFEIGSRGPLFWIDDGIERDGCQVVEDGVVCYSDRAGKGFLSWKEIFGPKFVKGYEQEKMGNLLDEYWYNGKSFFKLLYGSAVSITRDQLVLELRQAGFTMKVRKGQTLNEVENAILTISNQNRIHEIAPVIFSPDRVVTYNSHRILNNADITPTPPSDDGDPKNWPFLHKWLTQLFLDSSNIPTINYFYAWMKRFYIAVTTHTQMQGQALILVGPTNKGKSLLSNRVISALVGGFSDASDYLSGLTRFNKDLARVASWVIDDTTSAASFQDQLKATELIKRAVANPRVEYQAKYVDSVSIPWTGRVIISLNEDANSLSVIPALDSSNQDKIIALKVNPNATSDFPDNAALEKTINDELPHFARWLLDWDEPKDVMQGRRFGVASFIDGSIASAAYDNSSRSSVSELVDFFAKKCREYYDGDVKQWRGTLTEFLIAVSGFNDGRHVGRSNNTEFIRRGMSTMEEASKISSNVRPVVSQGHGGGKIWVIDIDSKYDIDQLGNVT